MTSIKIGIKLNLKLITIFWIDNQKLRVLNSEYELGVTPSSYDLMILEPKNIKRFLQVSTSPDRDG
jgi:hypothetical protein